MTEQEKINTVKVLIDNDSEATNAKVLVYLYDAKADILCKMYPFGIPEGVSDVPARYEMLQCKLASRRWLKRGAEGETLHEEDGISRHYASVNDNDLLDEVMTVAKVV